MNTTLRRREGSGLSRWHDEVNDVFGRLFGQPRFFPPDVTVWPVIDIAETEENVLIKAELPGCKPENIEVTVQGGTITLSGEKQESIREKNENVFHAESTYGRFRRDLVLPAEVKADKITAQYHDGVLTVTLPKEEKAKARRITIQT